MKSKVKVTADAAGSVITVSKNNPEWGHIRVTQTRMIVDDGGFARPKLMSALIIGTIADLKKFNYTADQEIEGKIVFEERLKPFNADEPERDYKKAGKTGVICCIDAQPIYRKNFYREDEDAKDTAVDHDNGEEIKIAYAKLKEEEKLAAQNKQGNGGVSSEKIDAI